MKVGGLLDREQRTSQGTKEARERASEGKAQHRKNTAAINNKMSKKPQSPPSYKSGTNKRAGMMCKGKIVLTARKLVSGGQEDSDWGCTVGGRNQRRAGRTSRDARAPVEANEGRRVRQPRWSRAESGLDPARDLRQGPAGSTRLRAAPLASPPTFSGPQDPAPTEAGAPEADEARRPLPVRPPRGRWTWPGSRGWQSRRQRGAHLSTRAASAGACETEELGVRLVGVLTQVRTIPPRARSHRHRSARNHRKAESRFVTGARLPAQSRRRACAVASVPREPGRGALPAFNRSQPAAPPLALSPPPPATPRPLWGQGPPPWAPTPAPQEPPLLRPRPPAPTEISRFVLPSRLAVPEFPREREACVNKKREPSRGGSSGA